MPHFRVIGRSSGPPPRVARSISWPRSSTYSKAGEGIRTLDVQLGKRPCDALSLCLIKHLRLGDTLGDQLGASRPPVGPTRSLARSQRQIGQEVNGCPASTSTTRYVKILNERPQPLPFMCILHPRVAAEAAHFPNIA